MKILLVAGARPNFMKIAPLIPALEKRGHQIHLVHTGQHYDALMSDTFFSELGIPQPHSYLGVGGGTQAEQLSRVIAGFEPVLVSVRPDWVVVVGDVTSTLGAAIVTVKLKSSLGCRLAHVEAGLRSDDWSMPEEVNRVLTDRVSDLLLTPSRDGDENLLNEGLPADRIRFVGNVMIDTLLAQLEQARGLNVAERLGVAAGGFALLTLHRPSNVDSPEMLRTILHGVQLVGKKLPVIFPVHPRTRDRIAGLGSVNLSDSIRLIDPVPYRQMLSLVSDAAIVLTDSGGVQEETTVLGIPCVTLREQTERPITITEGTNRLVAWPPTADGIFAAANDALSSDPTRKSRPEGWDGRAAERIVAAIESCSPVAN